MSEVQEVEFRVRLEMDDFQKKVLQSIVMKLGDTTRLTQDQAERLVEALMKTEFTQLEETDDAILEAHLHESFDVVVDEICQKSSE